MSTVISEGKKQKSRSHVMDYIKTRGVCNICVWHTKCYVQIIGTSVSWIRVA